MSCDEVKLALPLLEGGDAAEAELVRAHARTCSACAQVLQAHARDERALVAMRSDRAVPAIMGDFTARVMAQVARERAAGRPLGEAAPLPAALADEAKPGTITRFPFVRAAMAAGLLLAVALGTGHGEPRTAPPAGGAPGPVAVAPAPASPVAPAAQAPRSPVAPVATSTSSGFELAGTDLPAPRRVEAAPAAARRPRGRDGVVPVDGGRRGNRSFGGGSPDELLDLIENALPGLQRRLLDGRTGPEREVRF